LIGSNSIKKKNKFKRNVRKKNAYHGTYKGLSYRSALELSFILKCHAEGKTISNFDNFYIDYTFWDSPRKYFPDFLVNNSEITEIKALGFLFEKKKLQIEAKRKALEEFCAKNPQFVSKFITNKDIEAKYIKQAKDIARKEERCRDMNMVRGPRKKRKTR